MLQKTKQAKIPSKEAVITSDRSLTEASVKAHKALEVIGKVKRDRFKSADTLGITNKQRDALIKTLYLMEAGKIKHVTPFADADIDALPKLKGYLFNMNNWRDRFECGTIACIGGTAELVSGNEDLFVDGAEGELHTLFYDYPNTDPTPEQAAKALRGYLETGVTDWDKAIGRT